jgi:hypothetical protein
MKGELHKCLVLLKLTYSQQPKQITEFINESQTAICEMIAKFFNNYLPAICPIAT